MYPVHHPTLKIEQAERHADAALARLAGTGGGTRRRWRPWRTRIAAATPAVAPAPMPPVPAPVPAVTTTSDDDRVLVGR
ncbi:MAG: hypothetical protein R2761_22685 [Acidimicrobiales bacterium]